MVRHYRATDAEEKNDDGKAQRSLSHGDADREHREHHAGDIGAETRKRHQIDVDGVRISSMRRMPMVLRRVMTPNNPMQKMTAASVRNACSPYTPDVSLHSPMSS